MTTNENGVLDVMLRHRSIRLYGPDDVAEADVRRAVEAGQKAATSSNVQAYAVIRVRDAAVRSSLVELTGGQEKVVSAGAFFIVCGDTRRHRLIAARAGKPYATGLEAFLVAVVDATLFAQNMTLAFEAMGYGTCYIGGLRNHLPALQQMLGFPEGVYPLFGLCVGAAMEDPAPRPRLDVDAILMEERYADDAAVMAEIAAYDERMKAYYKERSGKERDWSGGIAEMYTTVKRADVGPYYRGQGAVME